MAVHISAELNGLNISTSAAMSLKFAVFTISAQINSSPFVYIYGTKAFATVETFFETRLTDVCWPQMT